MKYLVTIVAVVDSFERAVDIAAAMDPFPEAEGTISYDTQGSNSDTGSVPVLPGGLEAGR